ncbi:WXG100 family type VII secretion target [Solihabitans fulvus]|uniref:WXG100 family type VII secretion target n=1 Tax=Solihabitans fulvus TaxID=1892852 RepID=UPI001661B56C|nr:WXG100 family type VII secretion target [Solihabitans fulvus]
MSGGGYEVDVAALRSGGDSFTHTGDAIEAVRSTLQNALDSEGTCWGGDDSGKAFVKEYGPNSANALDALKSMVQAMNDIRTGIDQSADAYGGSDAGNAHGVKSTY